MKKTTVIIAAFPGTGKTTFFNKSEKLRLKVLDSDSSKFDKSLFPENYIEHIRENTGKVDYILISSHKEVREALYNNDIGYLLVYPRIELKQTYLQNYRNRGSSETFVDLLDENWSDWIDQMSKQKGCSRIWLKEDQYLSHLI